jgi:hypothetical protein
MSIYNYNDIFKNNYAANMHKSIPINKLLSIESNINIPKVPLANTNQKISTPKVPLANTNQT